MLADASASDENNFVNLMEVEVVEVRWPHGYDEIQYEEGLRHFKELILDFFWPERIICSFNIVTRVKFWARW